MTRVASWLALALSAVTGCHGASSGPAPLRNTGPGDGSGPIDAGVPDAAEPAPANPEEAWLREVRTQLRAMDLRRCAQPVGGLDPACLCADACALALPTPPSAGTRRVDWSDSLHLDVASDGRITGCEARPTAGSPWAAHPCPGSPP